LLTSLDWRCPQEQQNAQEQGMSEPPPSQRCRPALPRSSESKTRFCSCSGHLSMQHTKWKKHASRSQQRTPRFFGHLNHRNKVNATCLPCYCWAGLLQEQPEVEDKGLASCLSTAPSHYAILQPAPYMPVSLRTGRQNCHHKSCDYSYSLARASTSSERPLEY
jgi:hypothetical protein